MNYLCLNPEKKFPNLMHLRLPENAVEPEEETPAPPVKPTKTATINSTGVKNFQSIGVVCIDNVRISPVAEILLNRMAAESKNAHVRGMKFFSAGYRRGDPKSPNSAKGFLQKKGFGNTELMKPQRIDKDWLRAKDLIIVTEKYLRNKILFDFFPTNSADWDKKIVIMNESCRNPRSNSR